MEEQETPDLSKATVLNIDCDKEKIAGMVKDLALFCNGKDMSTIEVIFALDELAGRIIVKSCGGHPLVAAKLKQAVQQHLDVTVRIGFQATYAQGIDGEAPKIVLAS